jgi:hypothetical protein
MDDATVARPSGATRSSRLVPRLIQDDVSVVRRFCRHGGLSAHYIIPARISRECELNADDTSSFDEKDKGSRVRERDDAWEARRKHV